MYNRVTDNSEQDIISLVNLQHDCYRGKCDTSGTQHLHQEREITTRTRTIVHHSDQTHFILNTQSLHNYKYIMDAIPIPLRGSSFHVADPTGLRNQAASILRDKKHQQVEARKALSMAVVMGRVEAPSGLVNVQPVDEDSALRSEEARNGVPVGGSRHDAPLDSLEEECGAAPLEHLHGSVEAGALLAHHEAANSVPHERHQDAGYNTPLHGRHDEASMHVNFNTGPPPDGPMLQHVNIAEPVPHSHFPSGHPVFLQPSAGTSSQAQASTAAAVPTTL